MLFSSYAFILLFLPVALIVFFAPGKLPYSVRKYFLLLLSFVFIATQGILHAVICCASVLVNFLLHRLLLRQPQGRKKAILAGGIVFNILILCLFKYAPLFSVSWILPLGISFYTFQQIAFLVDCYRGEVTPVAIGDYSLFVLFFPKTVQGPIPYAKELLPAFTDPRNGKVNFDNIAKGLYLFSIGLAKKVMIADKFSLIANYGYQHISSLTGFESLLTILAYTFQLYFDFSGYSDMAVGIGYMFNIELPVNFDSPYKAKNISDFWKRWHITLTRFLTKYIYIPLGGNRKGALRTALHIVIVFLVSGLWHGTGINFLLWGLLHGVASVLYRTFRKQFDRIPGFLQWLLTFLFINVTWVLFRTGSLASAGALMSRVFTGSWALSVNSELVESLLQPTFISVLSRLLPFNVVIIIGFVLALICVTCMKNTNEKLRTYRPGIVTWITTYILLIISILSLSGVAGFLYENF